MALINLDKNDNHKMMTINHDGGDVKLNAASLAILTSIVKIHNKTNDPLVTYAMKFDTVVVGVLANRIVVVAMNVVKHENPKNLEFKVMQEGSSRCKVEKENYRKSSKLDINESKCGMQNEYVTAIKSVTRNYMKSTKLCVLKIVPLFQNDILLDHRKYYREFHAEMQILEFADGFINQPATI